MTTTEKKNVIVYGKLPHWGYYVVEAFATPIQFAYNYK